MIEKNDFGIKEKEQIFDKLFDMYFTRNFGTVSKSDLEVFLFSEFIEHCLEKGNSIDDYTLSRQFGITQGRIRSLKEKKELKYPRGEKFNWKREFAESVKNAKYDAEKHRVKMLIQDVNVLIEVRHYIEESDWYDEPTLNRKMLQIPLDCFIEICGTLDEDNVNFNDEAMKTIKKLQSREGFPEEVKELLKGSSKDLLKNCILNMSKNGLNYVLPTLPFGAIGKVAIEGLLAIINV